MSLRMNLLNMVTLKSLRTMGLFYFIFQSCPVFVYPRWPSFIVVPFFTNSSSRVKISFTPLLKVTRIYFGFALLRFVIGFADWFKNLAARSTDSVSQVFPRFLSARLHVSASSLDLLTGFPVSFVKAQMIGFGFADPTTLSRARHAFNVWCSTSYLPQ